MDKLSSFVHKLTKDLESALVSPASDKEKIWWEYLTITANHQLLSSQSGPPFRRTSVVMPTLPMFYQHLTDVTFRAL